MKEWLWGRHCVEAALANKQRKIFQIFVSDSKGEGESLRGLNPRVPCTQITSPRHWRELLPPGAIHQGIAAQVAPLEPVELSDVLDGEGPVVVLDQVTDPQNVGAIWRAAAVFGARAVVLTHRNSPETLDGVLAKTASGALERVPSIRVTNLVRFLEQLKQAGFFVLGLCEAGEHPLGELVATYAGYPKALVLGAEGKGLRLLTQQRCDVLTYIKTCEEFSTLNVSMAAAIALHTMTP